MLYVNYTSVKKNNQLSNKIRNKTTKRKLLISLECKRSHRQYNDGWIWLDFVLRLDLVLRSHFSAAFVMCSWHQHVNSEPQFLHL